jgi:hypothetical protein
MKGSTSSSLIDAVIVCGLYIAYFWRIFKKNRGNKLIECGVITLTVFFAMLLLSQLPGTPEWAFGPLIILVVLLCFSTLFFLAQRVIRAVGKKTEHSRVVEQHRH